MKPNQDYRGQAAKKILEDEGGDDGDEGEDHQKTLLESLDETEFPVTEHGEPEEIEHYLRGKTRYEEGE
jgi:hypothetical protein